MTPDNPNGGAKEAAAPERLVSERLVTIADPDGNASEAYRTLRTSLLYSLVDNPPRVIMLSSPGPREGKSTTGSNLAVALAQAGKNTILLDCDLRRPVIQEVFQLRNIRGIVDVLANERPIEKVWHEAMENLKVVTTGAVPPNPAELLGSERFSDIIRALRERFDYVLIDAPPVQSVSDPAIIASQSDGVLLVLDAQNTRKRSVRRSVQTLEAVGGSVIGTVLNNVKASDVEYYGYSGSYTR